MPYYRFYLVNEFDHFVGVAEETAADDDEAKNLAEKLAKSSAVEVWSGPRKLGRFDKKSNAASAQRTA
jgi:hypothetical protein